MRGSLTIVGNMLAEEDLRNLLFSVHNLVGFMDEDTQGEESTETP